MAQREAKKANRLPEVESSDDEYVDEPSKFSRAKASLMQQVVPSSLIPLATANGMLIIGSHKTPGEDCKIMKLPEYLLFTGAISLGLVIMGVVGRYVVSWILYDKVITRVEKRILKGLEIFSYLLILVEVLMLLAGVIVVVPHLKDWTHKDPQSDKYCEYGMVVFACVYLGMAWTFISIGLACMIIVQIWGKPKKKTGVVDVNERDGYKKGLP